ncbi:complexed with Cdc5 protein Cwf20 [Schizosaccharomyces pombe]|uniref:Pre-mRNA-splicing factor cwf20 n=1 Tax=Schizosaccharomyces pombe (strain 972 / ATCC 24843) TaxID=284812 RepID=CWF20_SCHPO|nr:protein Cwf20 [Schizosaccharomyces pombe]Q9USK4.1 RecName: Full=Pre-mRNA-splicing factor cwf20; AltName: Full=Complexed with cdc5 protein 20 [Schizosaccharomyces pombe 972h-]CAB60688.1 complexed with Cdc5 protein Cwf20 [Schizosaccharomyces pombe]|eukprot:NP_588076.1 protein Cwf20 [Schizosaccharomyces pombe]
MSLVSYPRSESESDIEEETPLASKSFDPTLFQHARRKLSVDSTKKSPKRLKRQVDLQKSSFNDKTFNESDVISNERFKSNDLLELLPAPKNQAELAPKSSKRSDLDLNENYLLPNNSVSDLTSTGSSETVKKSTYSEKSGNVSLFNIVGSESKQASLVDSDQKPYQPILIKPKARANPPKLRNQPENDFISIANHSVHSNAEDINIINEDYIEIGRHRKEKGRIIDVDINKLPKPTQEALPSAPTIKSVAPGRHQLSSLVEMAISQKDNFEAYFEQQRSNKKASSQKYGF